VGLILVVFFFSSRGRHTSFSRDWSSDVCSSDLDDVRRYIQRWVFEHEYRAPERIKEYALGAGLTEEEWDLWLKLSTPGAPEYILQRDDYFCVRYGILTTGRVPAGEVTA